MARIARSDSADIVAMAAEERTAARALRRVSWDAIFAGVVISLTVQFLLAMLGVGIGATTIDPASGDTPAVGHLSISAAAWWTGSGLIAAFVGGWIAARLACTPVPNSAMLHGLVTWATTMLLVFYLMTSAAGALIGGAFGVLGNVMSGAGETLRAVSPQLAEAIDGPMGDLRGQIESNLREGDAEARADALTKVTKVVSGGPNVPAAEREQAVGLIADTAGISREEAGARQNEWRETYQKTTAQIEQQARETADATARVVSRAAIYGFIALVLGAVAGALGGRVGRAYEPEL